MGKYNMNNPYRQKWLSETTEWLRNKGYVFNPDVNEELTCPKCGYTKILNKNDIHKSQFGYRICCKCYDDELIRDSIGVDQIDTKYWFATTRKRLDIREVFSR